MKVASATVLICTYNRAPLLHETLMTMQEMVAPEGCDVEIIVVDNNSSDDTARVVQHAAEHSRFPITLRHERRQGKSFALNTGLAAATGDVIALTDDDVLPASDWLARIVDAFRVHGVTFVFGKVLPRWSCTPPAELLTVPAQDIWGPLAIVDYGDEPAHYEARTTGQRLPIGANLAFLRSALGTIGGWRTDLGKVNNTLISGEDHEIFMRLKRHGLYLGYYDPQNFVRHYVPASRLTRKYFRQWFYWSGKTHALMLDELYPEIDMAAVPRIGGVPRFACRQALSQAWRYVSSRHGDALSALIEELRLMQYLGLFVECWRLRKRRQARAARAVTAALFAVWLQFHEGRVSLVATGATVSQILAEWARAGGTRVDNANDVQSGPMDLTLTDVPEGQALDLLVRQMNVVVVEHAPGAVVSPTASQFERIVIAPTSTAARAVLVETPSTSTASSAVPVTPAAPVAPAPPPNAGNPLVQRIIGRDGAPVPDDQQ